MKAKTILTVVCLMAALSFARPNMNSKAEQAWQEPQCEQNFCPQQNQMQFRGQRNFNNEPARQRGQMQENFMPQGRNTMRGMRQNNQNFAPQQNQMQFRGQRNFNNGPTRQRGQMQENFMPQGRNTMRGMRQNSQEAGSKNMENRVRAMGDGCENAVCQGSNSPKAKGRKLQQSENIQNKAPEASDNLCKQESCDANNMNYPKNIESKMRERRAAQMKNSDRFEGRKNLKNRPIDVDLDAEDCQEPQKGHKGPRHQKEDGQD